MALDKEEHQHKAKAAADASHAAALAAEKLSKEIAAEKAAEEIEVSEAESVDQLNPTEVTGNDEEVSFKAEGGKMKWKDAIAQARKELGITGFTAIKKGTPLYKRAKALSS